MNANARCVRSELVAFVIVCTTTLLVACTTSGTGTRTVPITPMCTILCDVRATSTASWNGQVFVSERTDPNVPHNFAAFRPMSPPLGDPAVGFTLAATGVPDTYGISEAWLRVPAAPEVHRAQATRAARTTSSGPDFFGSAWNITAQNTSGSWSSVGTGTANRGDEADTPEIAALTVPQLMAVGLASPQMFGCVGGRAENNGSRTTWLIESTSPTRPPTTSPYGVSGGVVFIQDVVNGDNYFVPNRPIPSAPLAPPSFGPPTPPTPTISGPGDQAGTGSVQCAMRQFDDDLATRELHMLAIRNGVLYHSMASDFGPVTDGSGRMFSRFRAVSGWGDVGQVLGGGFGTITSATVVAQASAVNVFFIAESGGRYRLWHAVRFSAGGGSWRPPVDVLSRSGDAANGSVYSYKVSAGICPTFGATVWDAQSTELLIALLGGPGGFEVLVIRVVSAPRQWRPGVNGIYSPWASLPGIPADGLNNPHIPRDVAITARPFRDNATPPSP
ncbi:hypothetical protein ACFQZQ_12685 [Lysobacter koreensis]|uniref:Exo-alpha-sialidase n=1 Tax=Lysobacter koreensis TaxID=266122 RepID=A0ABW2YUI3_9GAMM